MGEKIKTLDKGKLHGKIIEIELNHPTSHRGEQQIHIQNNKYRFELNKSEFIRLALTILVAEKNLKKLKNL